ncbi:hypothetical protein SRHO_G00315350 [Serrasalmus rhombeus]
MTFPWRSRAGCGCEAGEARGGGRFPPLWTESLRDQSNMRCLTAGTWLRCGPAFLSGRVMLVDLETPDMPLPEGHPFLHKEHMHLVKVQMRSYTKHAGGIWDGPKLPLWRDGRMHWGYVEKVQTSRL